MGGKREIRAIKNRTVEITIVTPVFKVGILTRKEQQINLLHIYIVVNISAMVQ
jgi:hypothetical protein